MPDDGWMPNLVPENPTPPPPDEPPTAVPAPVSAIRRRRRTRVMVLGAITALLLVTPVAAYAMTDHHGPAPAPAVGPTAPDAPAISSPTAPVASQQPPAPPAAPAAARPTRAAPDGRFTVDELAHATLDLPTWPKPPSLPCPSGSFTFHGNPTQVGPDVLPTYLLKIEKVGYVDVDRDGARETVALIGCYLQGGDMEVVAFDRDRAGHVVTVGLVVASSADGPIEALFDVRVADHGQVQVQVGDLHPCCGTDLDMVEHQWRTYAWDGRSFRQTGGPTRFTPAPRLTTLSVTATALRFPAAVDGARHGTFPVTIRNTGPVPAPGVVVRLAPYTAVLPQPMTISAPGCPVLTTRLDVDRPVLCHTGPLPANASREYPFRVVLPQADDPRIPTGSGSEVPATWVVTVQEEQPGIRTLDSGSSTEMEVTRTP